MKKSFAAAISFAAIITAVAPASAADMAVKAPPMAPLPVIYNWTGFYIGANGGWGQSRNCWDFVAPGAVFAGGGFGVAGGAARVNSSWKVRGGAARARSRASDLVSSAARRSGLRSVR